MINVINDCNFDYLNIDKYSRNLIKIIINYQMANQLKIIDKYLKLENRKNV
jgi:hypothetical protein